jgi:hypothetical protein
VPRREPLELVAGVTDARLTVAAFFDAFPWTPRAPDAARLSAQAFLQLLEGPPQPGQELRPKPPR